MLRTVLLGASALAISLAPALAAPLEEDARLFGTRERVSAMTMSPSGQKVAMLTAGPGSETVLTVADLRTGTTAHLTKTDGRPQSLQRCNFAGEIQLVCVHGGVAPYDNKLVEFSRMITIRADGSEMRELGQRGSFQVGSLRQHDGYIVDWLPGEDAEVLMARMYLADEGTTGSILGRSKQGLGVDRLNLKSMTASTVEAPKTGIDGYVSDGRGNVRLQTIWEDAGASGQLTGKMRIRYRTADSRDWQDLGIYDSVTGEGIYPLAIDAGSNVLYALRKTNGRDALYRIKLDGSKASTMVAADPVYDIQGVVRIGEGQRVIGYTYADDSRRAVYFDPEFSKLQEALGKAIPNQPAISFEGASADGQKLLILASGDTQPGTFYRFDKATKQLAEIMRVRPDLDGRTLATVKSIKVKAADGVEVPAYLTIPAGSSGKNLPAVVLPHGGPDARDVWGFDWLAQFLAARGYAVIQPNFRGSAGYGDEWLAGNGFKGWRTAIGDVSASARYLVAQGIADPEKLAIVGWSYGGYAALQSAAVEPELYKAVVAIAPVTDLAALAAESRGFTNERLVKGYLGEGPHLAEGSPLRNAAAIKAPVLMVHGTLDANVSIAQSKRMLDALKAQGASAELLTFKDLDHQLDDSSARIEMLKQIGAHLDRAFGG